MPSLDFIGAVEVAYDRTKPVKAWLEELTSFIGPSFSGGNPHTTAFLYRLDEQGEATIHDFVSVGEAPSQQKSYERQHVAARQYGPTKIAYECDPFTLLSRVVGREEATRTIQAAGIVADDAMGLRANMTADRGLIITTHVPRGFRIHHRDLWLRFASHVGAALRLRSARDTPLIDSAAAVLSPTGRLEHSSDSTYAARDDLSRATKDMDRARGRLRRLDPEGASAIWRTLVRGEWSLVDWIDHDGKRFILAHDNRVTRTSEPRPLTDRERQVVACAAMGHSNKHIAYDLGLSTGSVSVLLARAAAKLGVSGRIALIRAFRDSFDKETDATTDPE